MSGCGCGTLKRHSAVPPLVGSGLGVLPERQHGVEDLARDHAMLAALVRWASMSGSWLGRHDTPVASFIFFVMPSARAMKRSGHGMFSHCAVKCSPIHASS